ncbi:hypothetical protein [Goodfellowiella coeruleoviolacea]|uniref:Uncharacterized protein n=1 Tax=Goodfellowiella coeruleoviolacea TaxID=334858 RepID=A0AAE3GEK4_9PSEU|nr:hypothetical protein [Goodfellowiella coeruleoviolacea]MCP2165900.1 hypothetical protein [Goodfellowiella coeruleoviolacea]
MAFSLVVGVLVFSVTFSYKLAEIMAERLKATMTTNRQNAPPVDSTGPPGVHNEVSGTVYGTVIQTREVHLHQAATPGADHPAPGEGSDG